MERIKLIWDFRGPNAAPIAEHHVLHLKEFVISEKLEHTLCGVSKVVDMHYIAYLVVERKWMDELRARLKPHRGQVYREGASL